MSAEIETDALNVFVGANDEGKSNILRALHLFFSSTQRNAFQLDWDRDFCAFSHTPKGKAAEIAVELTLTLPASFRIEGDRSVRWNKVWRRNDGLYFDSITLEDGKHLPSRSKAENFLRAMRFEYVPAIKGPEYFSQLLSSVHDMLDATVRDRIRNAAVQFQQEIAVHTRQILRELRSQLDLDSEIELPNNLRRLFSDLEFRSPVANRRVSLSERGDGIKARHIPIILKWLAGQANARAAQGRPRVTTIWGYEEPENNLELRRCFDLAESFQAISTDIQTFLTTHSPVFYSIANSKESSKGVRILEVRRSAPGATVFVTREAGSRSELQSINESLGFLDLLAPHVKEWRAKVDELQRRIAEEIDRTKKSVFLEGPSDRIILAAAFKRFYPDEAAPVLLTSPANGGGHTWVKDALLAWHFARAKAKAIGLFDDDPGGKQSAAEFNELVGNATRMAKALRLPRKGHCAAIGAAGFTLPISIEELCPREVWLHAESTGWLERRPQLLETYSFSETEVAFDDWIASKLSDPELLLIATKRPKLAHKCDFANIAAELLGSEVSGVDFMPLKHAVDSLRDELAK